VPGSFYLDVMASPVPRGRCFSFPLLKLPGYQGFFSEYLEIVVEWQVYIKMKCRVAGVSQNEVNKNKHNTHIISLI
jgi:hypothetical protein